jgi:indole-3-glycerol phosphate synthase
MQKFVKTDTVLDRILANTSREIEARTLRRPLSEVVAASLAAPLPRDMGVALRRDTVALIAEVKCASPSRGVLIAPFDPLALGTTYAQNGAAAISVLTDQRFFHGHLGHLTAVRNGVNVPVLRKDFIIDPYQVYEARAAGADALLLIVAALTDAQLKELHGLTVELRMAALVEAHNQEELERALKVGPTLLGINNRDLKTFDVNLDTTARLIDLVPDDVTLVAESGIKSAEDVRQMGALGAHAVLVGESLVKAADIAAQVRALSSVKP